MKSGLDEQLRELHRLRLQIEAARQRFVMEGFLSGLNAAADLIESSAPRDSEKLRELATVMAKEAGQ